MNFEKFIKQVFFSLFLLFLFPIGCSKRPPLIRIGLLPIPDSLPFFIANSNKAFKDTEFPIEWIVFQSASERDAAFQGGEIDGMVTDLVVASLMQQNGIPIKIAFNINGKKKESSRVAILAASQAKISQIDELRGHDIAIAPYCIIDYVTDRLIQSARLDTDLIKKTFIPNISLRLAMLLENKIEVATLTDPYIDFAISNGARILLEDKQALYQIVFAVQPNFIEQCPQILQTLLSEFNNSVEFINQNPITSQNLLNQLCGLGQNPILEVPFFEKATSPAREQIEDIEKWLSEKGLLRSQSTFDEFVVPLRESR